MLLSSENRRKISAWVLNRAEWWRKKKPPLLGKPYKLRHHLCKGAESLTVCEFCTNNIRHTFEYNSDWNDLKVFRQYCLVRLPPKVQMRYFAWLKRVMFAFCVASALLFHICVLYIPVYSVLRQQIPWEDIF